jgi:predicted nuclease of predicted toxin-antitoxin system
MASDEFFERIVLDEDVPVEIGYKLEGRGIDVLSHENSASDTEVLKFAVKSEAPLLTKDEDFRERDDELKHVGILIDNQMHLRDWNFVADTIEEMLDNIPKKSMRNNVWRVSDYYGVF